MGLFSSGNPIDDGGFRGVIKLHLYLRPLVMAWGKCAGNAAPPGAVVSHSRERGNPAGSEGPITGFPMEFTVARVGRPSSRYLALPCPEGLPGVL